MALEEINKAVLESVQHEAELFIKSAKKEAEEKKKSVQRNAEEKAERLYQLAMRNIDEEMARKLVQVQGQINKEILSEKNKILSQIFQKAKEEILHLPAKEYQQLMEKWMNQAIPADIEGSLCVHKDDLELFKDLVSKWNNSHETKISINEENFLSSKGGFLFVGKGFQIDQTLDTILSDLEREIIPVIAKNLFTVKV
ncbi:MAG TPA: V-type ATP synthase subunit E [Candidatus Hydrogenedens sp.]|nr:V-type ATP synthase subunit E [Candidatus Hydrogenedens sp.]